MPAPRFYKGCVRAFLALTALAAAAAIFLKAAPALPEGARALFFSQTPGGASPSSGASPAPGGASPSSGASPAPGGASPTSEASLSTSPSPAPAAPAYAAITLGGETLAVLADADAAERALSLALDVVAARAGEESGGEAAASEFLVSPEVLPAGEGARPVSVEEAAALLSADDSPLGASVTLRFYSVESTAFETKTERDSSLMAGTRFIKSYGRDALVRVVFEQTVYSGLDAAQPGERAEVSRTVLREGVPRVVLTGRESVAGQGEEPGRREGAKGREPEGLSFSSPADAPIGANFGGADGGYRYGVDYELDEGAPVLAPEAGVVVALMERAGYGLTVEIDHGQGFTSRLAGLKNALVAVGQSVHKGEALGAAGEAGLRFEIRIDGRAYNPRYYIK